MKTSFPKKNIKILLLENIHQSAIEDFKKAGFNEIENIKSAISENELIEKIKDVHILGIRSKTELNETILNHAHKLLAVGCFCIGTNQVNLKYAAQKGIAVFNSPYSNTRSVAELVIAECIILIRKIIDKSNAAHAGNWLKDASGSNELRGKTLGIIGYGHIGSQVSIMAESMGMKVIYYDILPKLPLGNASPKKTLHEVLKQADIVTLHVPELPETFHLINKKTIATMKQNAVLLNLSRGNVVQIDDLAEALQNKKLKGASIDVFPYEPKDANEKFKSPLQGLSNVILTPHIGGSTEEAQEKIGEDVSSKIINFIDTGSTVSSKSLPELSLPIQGKAHRILHIHKNVPGMLSSINKIITDNDANISGQYLITNQQIGYVVLDIESSKTKNILEKLNNIPNTIRTRLLF
jgi:D-3-phosphoglycerate dehydrogenase